MTDIILHSILHIRLNVRNAYYLLLVLHNIIMALNNVMHQEDNDIS